MRSFEIYSWQFAFGLLVIAAAILALPRASFLDGSPQGKAHRFAALDGLRGLAALLVVIHHMAIYARYSRAGIWALTPSPLYNFFGQGGVAFFFMITGYLFCQKITNGTRIVWRNFYLNRVFRIGPIYLVAIFGMVVAALMETKFSIQSYPSLFATIAAWMTFGVFNIHPRINGYDGTPYLLAGVTWTIHYEWMFYFVLPLGYFFRRHIKVLSVAAFISCIGFLLHTENFGVACATLFLAGMTACSFSKLRERKLLGEVLFTGVSAGLLYTVVQLGGQIYNGVAILCLFPIFLGICSGFSLCGLLVKKWTHRLGSISYSIYLLQGLAFYLIFKVRVFRNYSFEGSLQYWEVQFISLLLLLCLATLAYLFIERPGIRLGRRFYTSADKNPADSSRRPLSMQ